MILRTTYTGTGGGVAEDKRFYYAQNWRADVSVVLDDAGVQQERVIYSPYGQPFAMPAGDTNFDGDFEAGVDGDDIGVWETNDQPYRAYADVNLDGDIDGDDATAASEHDLGWNVLTSGGVNNRLGYAGYIHDRDVATAAHVRYQLYKIDLGRWVQRPPSSVSALLEPSLRTLRAAYESCGGSPDATIPTWTYADCGTTLTRDAIAGCEFKPSIADCIGCCSDLTQSSIACCQLTFEENNQDCWDLPAPQRAQCRFWNRALFDICGDNASCFQKKCIANCKGEDPPKCTQLSIPPWEPGDPAPVSTDPSIDPDAQQPPKPREPRNPGWERWNPGGPRGPIIVTIDVVAID